MIQTNDSIKGFPKKHKLINLISSKKRIKDTWKGKEKKDKEDLEIMTKKDQEDKKEGGFLVRKGVLDNTTIKNQSLIDKRERWINNKEKEWHNREEYRDNRDNNKDNVRGKLGVSRDNKQRS